MKGRDGGMTSINFFFLHDHKNFYFIKKYLMYGDNKDTQLFFIIFKRRKIKNKF